MARHSAGQAYGQRIFKLTEHRVNKMKRTIPLAFTFFSILGLAPQIYADDPLPTGLDQAIRNPKIPIIVDASIVKYNKAGHGEIKVHAIYKPTSKGKKIKETLPKWIRGYGYVGSDKIAPLRIVAGGRPGRFLFLLDGDLLYSTYNNRFPIREGKNGALEVGIGFNGGGAPWKPLKDMVKLIPGLKGSK